LTEHIDIGQVTGGLVDVEDTLAEGESIVGSQNLK